ncbi:MAG TPA: alkaline phosphatase family protein [Nevskiaceae bacterium]
MARIDHVVVLMLENRSFDSVLGHLYPGRKDFDGVPRGARNLLVNGTPVRAWTRRGAGRPGDLHIPTPDPEEDFADMTEQIHGVGKGATGRADMSGFAANYLKTGGDPRSVMYGYTPRQLPVISALARSFAVSDRWFASAPTETWPNRFFVHAGTAGGYVNNLPLHLPYTMETVFNRLTGAGRTWCIYHHDFPQAATLSRIWAELPGRLKSFDDDFLKDARLGHLPNYSFIEPRYFPDRLVGRLPNDQHPPYGVLRGERLIARCYDAVRGGAGWERTLLVIVYDEHGGIWDHVPPPRAVSPDDLHPDGFAFDRYGVRVPAVLISPWIPAGSIVRAPGDGPPFDHTSIIATLRALFGPFAPLTRRDAQAPDLLPVLSLSEPSNAGPPALSLPMAAASREQLEAADAIPATRLQQALADAAQRLPSRIAHAVERVEDFDEHAVADGESAVEAVVATTHTAMKRVKAGLDRFLKGNGSTDDDPHGGAGRPD